jgi:hypothetical protein
MIMSLDRHIASTSQQLRSMGTLPAATRGGDLILYSTALGAQNYESLETVARLNARIQELKQRVQKGYSPVC